MDFLLEMPRFEEIRNAIIGVVVDEDGAQERLLGIDIMGRQSILPFAACFEARHKGVGGHGGSGNHTAGEPSMAEPRFARFPLDSQATALKNRAALTVAARRPTHSPASRSLPRRPSLARSMASRSPM
jgi:hypothetical protein